MPKHDGNYRFSVTFLGALLLVFVASYSAATAAAVYYKRGPDAPCVCCDGGTNCPECAGGDRFDAYSGNVHRAIKDLEIWGGVGQHQLVWMRHANSRKAAGGLNQQPFGEAHHWRHAYQWEMEETGPSELSVHYPAGGSNSFNPSASDPTVWEPIAVVGKRIFQDGSNFVLQMEDGYRYRFEKQTDADGSIHYQMEAFTDTQGNLYDLVYDPADRTLMHVKEPAGRFFTIIYKTEDGLKVIDQVLTSDGRSATYKYTVVNDGVTSWLELTSVTYGDETVATYEYHQQAPGVRPLLEHAVDPRLDGRSVDMRYVYDATEGFVLQEKNGKTGEVLASLERSGAQRIIEYANGGKDTLTVPIAQQGQVDSGTDSLGRVTEYTYDADGTGFLIEKKDAEGRVTKYTRTIYGNPLSITYAAGTEDEATESWTRDDLDLVLTHTDERGFVMTNTRDALHRITRIDYPDGAFETFTYNDFGQVLTHRRRNGGLEEWDYDEDERQLKIAYADETPESTLDNPTATYTYDTADRLASVTDARAHTTNYEYNERGLMTKIIYPLTLPDTERAFVQYQYNDFGDRTQVINELGNTWVTAYDEFRRRTSLTDPPTVTHPLGRTTVWSYDLPGGVCGCAHEEDKPTKITLPSGKMTAIEYDTEWQKTAETVGDGSADAARTEYEYDEVGNLTTMTDPRAKIWTTEYDQRDRKKSFTDPLGNKTAWTYDDAGNVLTATRPDLGVTTYDDYDPMNRLKQMTDPHPQGQVTQYAYDAEGNLVTLTDANAHVYEFKYEDLRNLRTQLGYPGDSADPDGSAEKFAYDAVGNLATYTTRAGQVRTYTYDERDRETRSDWSDATPDITTRYDAANRILRRKSSVSTLTYAYDEANQLLSETQAIRGTAPKTIAYDYNEDALPETLTYPDGSPLTYAYTGRNQLGSITPGGASALVEYAYDLNGNRLTKDLLENATSVDYVHDDANRMTGIEHRKDAIAFASFGYGYDAVDRRTFVSREDGRGDEFGYDAVDQLTDVLYQVENPDADPNTPPLNPARTVHYEYHATADGRVDQVGNRLEVVDNGVATSYEPNELNQYTEIGALALTYTPNGNLKSHDGWTYTYDAQNRLTRARNGVTTVTFKYDPMNRQAQRVINGVKTFFYYDGWNLIEERDGADVQLAEYVHGAMIDELLSKTTSNGAVYYHQDSIGSVTQLTDADGEVMEKYEYDVFGQPTIQDAGGAVIGASGFGNRFLFTGREFIQETGLYDYRNRVYSGELGRFLQTDPIRFDAGDVNLYTYVSNNSVNSIDPTGLAEVDCAALLSKLRNLYERLQTNLIVAGELAGQLAMAERDALEGRILVATAGAEVGIFFGVASAAAGTKPLAGIVSSSGKTPALITNPVARKVAGGVIATASAGVSSVLGGDTLRSIEQQLAEINSEISEINGEIKGLSAIYSECCT
ncbi:MAG: RHS repeat-associated core domain-containing protein [Gammaproteobacteria bacterium]